MTQIDESNGYVISIASPDVEEASLEFWDGYAPDIAYDCDGKNLILMMMKQFRAIISIINYLV